MEPKVPIRVASIPSGHPYVAHLSDVARPDDVVRLDDPPPAVEDPAPDQWWPPAMLEPGWVTEHRDEFDLVHLHFGFDASTPADLDRWILELATSRCPLVFTVHDLVNPHFSDQTDHLSKLDRLIPAAQALLTLTPGAAAEIERRWNRTATVVPHPHIVPRQQLSNPARGGRTAGRPFLIGVNAKNLRANLDPLPVLAALAGALDDLPPTVVRVDLHPEVLNRTDGDAVPLRRWLDERASDPRWRIEVHPRLSDDDLFAYLGSLDLAVLPYRFGTHSGWLEACVDLGTRVLVPDVGYYAEQHGHPAFHRREDGSIDQPGFTHALLTAILGPPVATVDRVAQRQSIADAHGRVYRQVLT